MRQFSAPPGGNQNRTAVENHSWEAHPGGHPWEPLRDRYGIGGNLHMDDYNPMVEWWVDKELTN